jgi:hypothetical protein
MNVLNRCLLGLLLIAGGCTQQSVLGTDLAVARHLSNYHALHISSASTFPFRWNSARQECMPSPHLAFPHQHHWLLYFDAFYVSMPGQVRHLGISSPQGSPIKKVAVLVAPPSGVIYRTVESVSSTTVHYVTWPTDFDGAPKVQRRGTYTVIWRISPTRILGCAGFTVR